MRRFEANFAAAVEHDGVRPDGRYTPVAQALHWLTAVLMLVAVVVAWVFMEMPDTAGDRFRYGR